MFVCCECCVSSGRGLCHELITRPEESYRLWCSVECVLETSRMRRPWPAFGCSVIKKKSEILYDLCIQHDTEHLLTNVRYWSLTLYENYILYGIKFCWIKQLLVGGGGGKRRFVSWERHEGVWRSRCIAPFILNLGARWGEWSPSRCGCFTSGDSRRYPLNGRVLRLHSRFWHFEEDKTSYTSQEWNQNVSVLYCVITVLACY